MGWFCLNENAPKIPPYMSKSVYMKGVGVLVKKCLKTKTQPICVKISA